MVRTDNDAADSLHDRPGIFLIGPPNVGKRTILSRMLSLDYEDASDSLAQVHAHGWTIDTKYYTADVSVWMAHLHDGFAVTALPVYRQLAALVMVFDMSDLGSLAALQDWVSRTNTQKFDIQLCIGNKADLVPGHSAHVEYRRRLQRLSDSADPLLEFTEHGFSETEGCSLLGGEEPSWEIKKSCLEWCSERNIEYIEACASNVDFDKCLSVDGDSQGIERIIGALSAHVWPGMVLKSGSKILEPSFPEDQVLSEEESDYEIEYEVLSAGSAEPWDDRDDGWVSANGPVATAAAERRDDQVSIKECDQESPIRYGGENPQGVFTSIIPLQTGTGTEMGVAPEEHGTASKGVETNDDMHYEHEDLEQLMSEIGNMRNSLRLMPDFQRREMAAKLALKMATMFGDSSGEEEGN